MGKILIVEDDELIAELERDYLEVEGYEVEICGDGVEGMRLAKEGGYDLLLLDVMLPGISGFNICREIRKTQNVPIILVTARQDDVDKIRGLGLGADDYVVKPFRPAELVARVKAHIQIHERLLQDSYLANHASESQQVIERKDMQIQVSQRRVFVHGVEVVLKNKEFELLLFLASNPGIVFSKETLLDRIWGYEAISDTATVTVHINRIREKISKIAPKEEYIQTVWGTGYRFISVGKTSTSISGE